MSAPGGTAPGGGTPRPVRSASVTTSADRVRDIVALILVLAGIGLILVSHVGMQRLATQPIVVAKGQSAGSIWNTYAYMDYAGKAVAVIGVIETTRAAVRIGASTYRPIPPFLVALAIYLVVIGAFVATQRMLERRRRAEAFA